MLSAHDMHVWGLVQHVLVTWSTLVIFKSECFDVRTGARGHVTFFVPDDATYRDEIVSFLRRELESFRRDGFPADVERDSPAIPGTDVGVEVVHFSGVMPHLTMEENERMVQQIRSLLVQRMKHDEKKREKEDDGG